MLSDTLKDYMLFLIGVAIATWQIVEEFRKKGSVTKIVILFLGIATIGWLGLDQIDRINEAKTSSDNNLKEMSNQIDFIKKSKTADSLYWVNKDKKDEIFQAKLFEEFKIVRDTILNKPVKANLNTYIHFNKAEQVDIW